MTLLVEHAVRALLETRQTGHVHLIGLGGAGMKSLANFFRERDWSVSGSDAALRPHQAAEFTQLQILAYSCHAAEQLPVSADLVVHSLAIPETNPELRLARQRELPVISYVELLGLLLQIYSGTGIAGTHGKTTTSMLLTHLFQAAGRQPGVLCGGRLLNAAEQACPSENNVSDAAIFPQELIVECCEFRQSFLKMAPRRAALLTVEPDHFDCYPDRTALLAGFSRFCENIPAEGLLVVNADSPLAVQAARSARCLVWYYTLNSFSVCSTFSAFSPLCEAAGVQNARQSTEVDSTQAGRFWQVTDILQNTSGTEFSLTEVTFPIGAGTMSAGSSGRESSDRENSVEQAAFPETAQFRLPLFGKHQVSNATAAVLLARANGLTETEISSALACFPGVERRFQERGVYRGWQLLDDYAHHPTEIQATIAATRQKYPGCWLTVAFQPHQILRTQSLMSEFAEALTAADQVLVLPIFAAREQADQRVDEVAAELVQAGNQVRKVCEFCSSLDQLRLFLDDTAIPDKNEQQRIFLTLGAGDIDRIFYELPG